MTFTGAVVAICRHPIKGFTPEHLERAAVSAGAGLAFDRDWAVENGPSGFDPAAPAFISKSRFVVLAPVPAAAAVRTVLDEASGRITASAPGHPPVAVDLTQAADAERFATWLTAVLGEAVDGPLKVVQAPGHRFLDDPAGQISITNRASLEALEAQIGAPLDPRRLRGNIEIEGWPAFAEVGLAPGDRVQIGPVLARVVKPIQRCIATHVNPDTAERDVELVPALMRLTGHAHCGVYVQVEAGGEITLGDRIEAGA